MPTPDRYLCQRCGAHLYATLPPAVCPRCGAVQPNQEPTMRITLQSIEADPPTLAEGEDVFVLLANEVYGGKWRVVIDDRADTAERHASNYAAQAHVMLQRAEAAEARAEAAEAALAALQQL